VKTLFQDSSKGRTGVWPKEPKGNTEADIPACLLRDEAPKLPELSEIDVIRHFTRLSRLNYSVDSNFYPLGSCTMKYNPKFTEAVAAQPGFTALHPLIPQLKGAGHMTQGALEVLYETEQLLGEITGMSAFTLQPMAGAHGELTGVMLMAAYHNDKGNRKTKIIVPDSAHGTNPASAAIAGYDVVSIQSRNGMIDPDELEKVLDDEVAGLMMTCPNTLGLFECGLERIVELVHGVAGLLYYDGANLNAIMGKMRVGDWLRCGASDLHNTFATTRTRGGSRLGPVGRESTLVDISLLPAWVNLEDAILFCYDYPKSSATSRPFYGNFESSQAYAIYCVWHGRQCPPIENAVWAAN
jgi:glycine dehydrogenase subunit 2